MRGFLVAQLKTLLLLAGVDAMFEPLATALVSWSTASAEGREKLAPNWEAFVRFSTAYEPLSFEPLCDLPLGHLRLLMHTKFAARLKKAFFDWFKSWSQRLERRYTHVIQLAEELEAEAAKSKAAAAAAATAVAPTGATAAAAATSSGAAAAAAPAASSPAPSSVTGVASSAAAADAVGGEKRKSMMPSA